MEQGGGVDVVAAEGHDGLVDGDGELVAEVVAVEFVGETLAWLPDGVLLADDEVPHAASDVDVEEYEEDCLGEA